MTTSKIPTNIAKLLELTPEKQAKMDAEQAEWGKLANSRARLNKREQGMARGVELEHHHRQTGNRDGYAEALAMQGRFQEAANVAKRKDLKQTFIEKHVAVMQADDDCQCDNFRNENGLKVPNQSVECYAFSEKHKSVMPFIRCHICGNLNAKPLPEYLQKQKEAENQGIKGEDFFKRR